MVKKCKYYVFIYVCIILPCLVYGQDIFTAIRNNDLDSVKEMIKNTRSLIEQKDKNLMTPLSFASYYGKNEIVKYLIEAGANVNYQRGGDGESALHFAAYFDYIEIAKMLVEHGINLNAGGRLTPIIAAINTGSKKIAEFLISKGAEIPVSSSMLHDAASHGMEGVVNVLLEKNVNLLTQNDSGGSILHSAAKGGLYHLSEVAVSKGLELNGKDRYGLVPLQIAAEKGYEDVIKFLIEKGANINIKTNTGLSSYQLAVLNGHDKAANILKRNGADTNIIEYMDVPGDRYFGQKKPGFFRELFAPGIMSTAFLEHGVPSYSPDGKEVYWTILNKTGYTYYMQNIDGKWTFPELAPIFKKYSAGHPRFSWDGKRIYFESDISLEGGKTKDIDLYFIEREADGWSKPKNPGSNVNSKDDERFPCITETGTIYFNVNYDIYRSVYKDGKYLPREKLQYEINTEHIEMQPTVAKDESYLIFPSARPGGINEIDIYISFQKSDGTWTMPKSMGNTGDGIFTGISPDEKYLFFCGGDISWVDANVINKIKNIKYTSISEAIIQTISERDIDAAIVLYLDLKKEYPYYYDLGEAVLNVAGYRLLGEEKYNEAIEIFKLNVENFPESANVYDSLGEAYMKNGNKELAVKNYRKSLNLNPGNNNAREMLQRLNKK